MSYKHLGHMMAVHRSEAGHSLESAAEIAGVSLAAWQAFEGTGVGVRPAGIGLVAETLGVNKEALAQLDDPIRILGIVWGPELGQLIREHRAFEPLDELASRSNVSRASITRWERAVSRPRNTVALGGLLAALRIDPIAALRYALWPPKAMMVDRPPLGKALLAWRTAEGLSLRNACKLFGVKMAGYHAWERGRNNPSQPLWDRIGEVLGVGVEGVERLLAPDHVDTFGLDEASKKLVKARMSTFTTRRRLAAAAGLKENQIARYELGQSQPTIHTFAAYTTAMGLDPMDVAFERLGTTRGNATFGQTLYAARKVKGLTARDAAKHLAASHTQLCHWEADRCFPMTKERRASLVHALERLYGIDKSVLNGLLETTVEVCDPFAGWLQGKLTDRGITRKEAAHRLGVRPQMVRGWTMGEFRPGAGFITPLAKVLGVPVKDVAFQLTRERVRAA